MGVPEGTVLGAILFSVYKNRIDEVQNKVIDFISEDWNDVKNLTELNFLLLMLQNRIIAFSTNIVNQYFEFNIQLHSYNSYNEKYSRPTEEGVSKIKYLRCNCCNYQLARWTQHIPYLNKRTRSLMNRFNMLRAILSTAILIMLYRSLAQFVGIVL